MTIITRQPVRYTHARGGAAPATFGQRDMWIKLASMGEHTWSHNILQAAPVPHGLTVADVQDAIRALVLRHETLRTRYRHSADGLLWQRLPTTDEIPCDVWEIAGEDPDVVGPLAERELERHDFDLLAGLPTRVLIGTLHGTPTVVLVGMSHIAVDMLSARVVRQDLVELLAARAKDEPDPELPPRRQPLDHAAHEATINPATTEQALAAWRQRFTTAPPTMFGVRAEPRAPREFLYGKLSSEAFGLATDVLSNRYRLSTAAVVMAAKAVVLAHYAGTDRAAFHVCVGNRIARDLNWSTGILRQHTLTVIDVAGAGFAQVVRHAWAAWLQAQRTVMCDPADIAAVRADVAAERGVAFDHGAYFNDLRLRTTPRTEAPALARILAAAQRSRFTWTNEFQADYMRFQFRLHDHAGRTELGVYVDTAAIPRARVPELLFGIERLLVWQATAGAAADGPLTPPRLAHVTGIPAVQPPPGWLRVDGAWADPTATAELLALAADGAPTAVRVTDDGHLTGYVCGPYTPQRLHERCVALLADRQWHCRNAITPRRYVVCAPGPGDWPDRPVLAQGGGR